MGYIKGILMLLITVPCLANIPLLPPSERWMDDFAKAQELSQKQQRPLLIAFLGPDWCPCSDKLEEEILMSRTFLSALNEQVIFLRVDIGENYDHENSMLNTLKEQYRIETCPSLVLVAPTGQEIAKIEYLPLEGKEFAVYIKGVLSDYCRVNELAKGNLLGSLQADELKALYTQAGKFADATFKNILLEEGLKADKSPYFLIEQYGRLLAEDGIKSKKSKVLRNKIIARDINNEQGYRRQIALMDFEALATVKHPKGAKAVVKPLLDYLQKFGSKDIENAWEIELKISRYLFSHDQIEEALKHANASLKIAPESKRSEIAQSVEYLKTFLNAG